MLESKGSTKSAPKVFISYAHESPKHKDWVAALATRLRAHGIDALLDDWRVDLGEDFTLFMDQNVGDDMSHISRNRGLDRLNGELLGGLVRKKRVSFSKTAQSLCSASHLVHCNTLIWR